MRFATTVAISIVHPSLTRTTKKNKNGGLRAKLHDGDDPLLQAAINGASLRFQESHRPEPLFIDPYAGCFVSPDIQMDMEYHPHHHYCLATKFIDDKLISTMNNIDGLKQMAWTLDHIGSIGHHQPLFLTYLQREYSQWQLRSLKVLSRSRLTIFSRRLSAASKGSAVGAGGTTMFSEEIERTWLRVLGSEQMHHFRQGI